MNQATIISINLKRLLKEKNKRASDMAKATGISNGIISGYINAQNVPRMGKIQKMADYLGVDTTDITNYPTPTTPTMPLSEFTTIPILGSIPCGNPKDREPEHLGELMIRSDDVKGGEYFAMYAEGDSMSPTILNGDTVVVRRQPEVENGEMVAACINGEITLKRFKMIGNAALLMPDNPSYEPISLHESDCSYIVGKVAQVMTIRKY